MNRGAVEEQLERIVREELLLGSERELRWDAPLGELGLDSLALVNLLTSAEASFGVAFDDDVWVAREPLSLDRVASLVREAGAADASTAAAVDVQRSVAGSRGDRLERALASGRFRARVVWPLAHTMIRLKRLVFDHSVNVILERQLTDTALPLVAPPTGVELRPYEAGDERRLSGLWPPSDEKPARRELARAREHGASALVALEGDHVVALDLLSPTGEEDVRVVDGTGACYGYRLVVAPAARRRGIGAALLAYSLRFARERGFRVQLTFVDEERRAMLVTATQLLGFHAIGRARRIRIGPVTYWRWTVHGRRGAGRRLLL